MAQRPKTEVRAALLDAAARQFAEAGYGGTSLRAVASAANRSLGNLRNYFATKDELFRAVCDPVVAVVDRRLASVDHRGLPGDWQAILRLDTASVRAVASFIVEQRTTLSLLLEKSHGSSLAAWADELFEAYVEIERSRLAAFVEQHPRLFSRVPSRHLVRALCGMYFELATEFVRGKIDIEAWWTTIEEFDAFRQSGLSIYLETRA